MIRLRQPELLLLGLWFGLTHDPLGILRISLLCSLLHESGHIAAWIVFTGTLPMLELSPGGIGLCLGNARLSPCKEGILAAAGPAVNLIAAGMAYLWMLYSASYWGWFFLGTNLLVGGFNLLPVGPLDGKRIWNNFFGG
ncbi:peptidase [Fournierella sp.]|uniref:peptidase n=1 Tax=Allofournierella sp. TaxID=1940256 RepID=UPI0025BB27F8|nr:peptidase [Fournierella sp.]